MRPLKLTLEFHLERPKKPKFQVPAVRPDLDNYVKAIMDAGNDFLWQDDGLICSLSCSKIYASARPKIIISIEEI